MSAGKQVLLLIVFALVVFPTVFGAFWLLRETGTVHRMDDTRSFQNTPRIIH